MSPSPPTNNNNNNNNNIKEEERKGAFHYRKFCQGTDKGEL